ncbi:MAG: 16S rRNA (guanine(527)-N(7))-methyltransferase RsmG, partial [Nitrospinaceae bacterium]|nr:16S rRNA (guanine(527)-N(7))-methyltransferase RsmG [Nitrospinaceae bacterium]
VSRETLGRLEAYGSLLKKWQAKINLIGPATLPNLWGRHFLDSAQIAPLIKERFADSLETTPLVHVDLGSGAGFPGLVLAILGTEQGLNLDVHLIESDQRKCAFLREAARITDTQVTLHEARIDAVTPFPADIVTARALAPLDKLLGYAARFWSPETEAIFLKGQDVDKELMQATKSWSMVTSKLTSRTESTGTVLCVKEVRRV